MGGTPASSPQTLASPLGESTAKLGLLDLPTEVRLQVFESIDDSSLPRSINLAQNCAHRIESHGCATLAALSRTCRAIHNDVAERLYRYRYFNVDIMGTDSLMGLWRRNFSPDFVFLERMQSVHLAISLNTGTTRLRKAFDTIRRVLIILAASTELRDFTVMIREIYHLRARHNYVNARLQSLREQVAAEGVEAGMTFRAIEFDYAWKALEFFENGFR